MATKDAPNGDDSPRPGPARTDAGGWLEKELLAEVLGPLPALSVGAGMLLAMGAHRLFGELFVLMAAIPLVAGAAALWFRGRRQREALRKGHVAERQIGRALEEAITARGCAVAHNVTGVMDSGDIDHIVATPRSVWVIETKYRRVPKDAFPGVVARLRACRRRVEELLPIGTPVRACLVLAYEGGGVRKARSDIRVFNNETFREGLLRDLRAERGESQGTAGTDMDEGVARTIWRLSRGQRALAVDVSDDRDEGRDAAGASDAEPNRLDEVRSRHPRAYERWTAEDDRRLLDLREAGWDEADLASEFDRQPSAIRARLRRLA